ncbi:MAG: acyltransferase family protein, partial [Aeoliella sp.]
GVSMAYSYAKRQQLGDSFAQMLRHAVYRAIVLILLGVFLRSNRSTQKYWTFEDVVTQIGLGYVFLFLIWQLSSKARVAVCAAILAGYWLLFALSPIRDPVGVAVDWPHLYEGFFAHWNKNANPGHLFDVGLLNLFPRESPFEFNGGGYNTLNFVPSLAIMIIGLMAGDLLRSDHSGKRKFFTLVACGIAGLLLGWLLDRFGICPLVKRAWTSGFTIYSGGWCLLILAALYGVIDLLRLRRWAFPLVVMGMNSIALYVMIWLTSGWIQDTLHTHLGSDYAGAAVGETFGPLLENLVVTTCLWLVCFWMYRKRIFLRI